MITYSKTTWGLHLLGRLYGSALLRCVPISLLSAAMTALLFVFWQRDDAAIWRHPYPYTLSAFIVGFVVVFRNNLSYQRYWEGRTHLQEMSGRWADAFTQAVCFHGGREGGSPERAAEFQEALQHVASLMHALALQHLRGDWQLSNLQPWHPTDPPPPVDSAAVQYVLGPAQRPDGSWRISVADLFMLNGTPAKRARYNRAMPLGVVGGLSPEEARQLGGGMPAWDEQKVGSALLGEDLAQHSWAAAFFRLSTGPYVPGAAERVNVAYAWLLQLLRQRCCEGELVMPSPIAANLFHMLSEGLMGFENARKLADTPFPFPWAQAVLVLLLMFAFTAPLLIVAYVEKLWLAVLLDVISVQSYLVLNEVARDLEDPYIFEPNNLPLARIQFEFNARLRAACAQRPPLFCKGEACMAESPPSHRGSQELARGFEQRHSGRPCNGAADAHPSTCLTPGAAV